MTLPEPPETPRLRTVLIVEDNELVAKFYRMALERVGAFRCLLTENVAEMFRHIETGDVDIAILDVSLSGTTWDGRALDGVELTRLLKAHSLTRAGKPLPVLLATAHAMAGDRERLLSVSGADDYLEKPIYEARHLVDKVAGLLKPAAGS